MSKNSTILIDAIQSDCSSETIKKIIQDGIDINAKDKYGDTALIYAANKSNLDFIDILVNNGADVNIVLKDKSNLLINAIIKDDYKLVSKLLNLGINTDIRHQDIYTPLFLATLRVNLIVKELINNKVNIDDVSTETNITALMEAVTKSEKIVDILLKSNCDVNLTDSNGKTALMYASESKGEIPYKLKLTVLDNFLFSVSAYRLIRRQFGKYKYTSRNFKPPNINKIIDKLIKADSNIKHKDKNGEIALFYAIKKGKVETIGQLIRAGIDINETDKYGYTPLMISISNNYNHKIYELLKFKPDLNIKAKDGYTALQLCKDIRVKKLLIENGVRE